MSVDDSVVAYGMLLDIIWVVGSVTSCYVKGTSIFVTKTYIGNTPITPSQ